MKATALAPANIAFIKYWGKKDQKLNIPANDSISMNLSNLFTITTVEFNEVFTKDEVIINNQVDTEKKERVIKFINLIRDKFQISKKVKIVSKNNFPLSVGLSSSASAFAALTVAAVKAAGFNLNKKELTCLARQGSGSACRSIPDGFVEWQGETAKSLYPPEYWSIVDIVVLVDETEKEISSTQGQRLANSSPFFKERQKRIKEKIKRFKKALKEKDFTLFGNIIEGEALELHAIMLTSTPSLIYWQPATVKLMKLVKQWRNQGLEVYFTFNTGQNIHLIVEEKNKNKLIKNLNQIKEAKNIIVNYPSIGARLINNHLF